MSDHEARLEIMDTINRFATGIDRRDWAVFRSAFTDGCQVKMGEYGSFDGVDAIARFEEDSHSGAGHSLHRMSNHTIEVDGDSAVARTYVDAWIMSPDNVSGVNAIGYYDDDLVRTVDGWRIARRSFTQVRFSVSGTGG